MKESETRIDERAGGVRRSAAEARATALGCAAFVLVLLLGVPVARAEGPAKSSEAMQARMMKKMTAEMQALAPARGYLDAHAGVKKPLPLLGGPVHVTIGQKSGGVFVALPDERRLDPVVFGTPAHPRAFGGTPGINGVPLAVRAQQGGHYTHLKKKTPFGDKYMVLADGRLKLTGVDATATDAATTSDHVEMLASWKDKAGNTYSVRCCKMMAAHGVEFPTFGGVVTNHILHGFTRLGTALMPTEFAYFAFWGMGQVSRNGEVLDAPRLVHGMLTEYVRTKGYRLAFDSEVTPTRRHFHLMVPPFVPNPKAGHFEHKAVKTGMVLPNGMDLPFWHVMFENLDIEGRRG